jgi:hypothetical protein
MGKLPGLAVLCTYDCCPMDYAFRERLKYPRRTSIARQRALQFRILTGGSMQPTFIGGFLSLESFKAQQTSWIVSLFREEIMQPWIPNNQRYHAIRCPVSAGSP